MATQAPATRRRRDPESGRALVLEDVTRSFGDRAVLERVSLEVSQSEFVAVVGRSGSGKSTLVHLAAGLEVPDGGRILVQGTDLAALSVDDRATFRLRNVGVVFQHFNLLPDLTVAENVALPLRLAHVPRAKARPRSIELLGTFGLADFGERFPEGLSGGELQRVAVARALANRPAVILADEPTANLDDENAREVAQALRTAADAGTGVLVASHDALLNEEADRRLRLHAGELVPED